MMNPDPIKEIEGQLMPYESQPGFDGFDFSYYSRPISSKGGRSHHRGRVANTKLMIQDIMGKEIKSFVVKLHKEPIREIQAPIFCRLSICKKNRSKGVISN